MEKKTEKEGESTEAKPKKSRPKCQLVAPPRPEKARVSLRVFVASHSRKPGQLAGFASYAKRSGLGPMTIEDWRSEVEQFNHRPMR